LGMEYSVCMEFCVIHWFNIVEIMAIVTGGGILIACRYRFAVNRLPVNRFLVMTLNTLGNDNAFVIFPITVRMDVGMAIGAFDILLYMNTGIMLGIFFFMAALTPDPLHFYLTLHVPGKIGKLNMAAVAAILAVNRRDKGRGGDFISVAAEAGLRVDGHTLLRPKWVSRKKNYQDHERYSGKHIQDTDPLIKYRKTKILHY
jgi:hypothetical protein